MSSSTTITQARLKQLEYIEHHYTDIIAQGIASALTQIRSLPRRRRRKITFIRPMTPPVVPKPISACPSPTAQITAPVQPTMLEMPLPKAMPKPSPLYDDLKTTHGVIQPTPHRKHTNSLFENPGTYTSPSVGHLTSDTPDPPTVYNSIAHLKRSLL